MKTNRETIKQDLNEDIEMVMCTEDVVYTNTNAKELKELQDTFLKIERKGIRTLEALQKDLDLYNELSLRLYSLIGNRSMQTRTSKRKNGGHSVGNYAKVKFLNSRGIRSEDLQLDLFSHVLERLDKVLAAPLEARAFYIQRMVNNKIVDILRALPPVEYSLFELVNSEDPEGDTKLDRLPYHPTPTVRQIRAQEQRGRNTLYSIVKCMSGHSAELLVRLGRYFLGYSNEDLCCMLRANGIQASANRILDETCHEFEMSLSVLLPVFPVEKLTWQDFGLEDGLSEDLASQLTKLSRRGRDYMKAHDPRR